MKPTKQKWNLTAHVTQNQIFKPSISFKNKHDKAKKKCNLAAAAMHDITFYPSEKDNRNRHERNKQTDIFRT